MTNKKKITILSVVILVILAIVFAVMCMGGKGNDTNDNSIRVILDGKDVVSVQYIDDKVVIPGSEIGVNKEYVTLDEVEDAGYIVTQNGKEITIAKIQDISGNIKDDVDSTNPTDDESNSGNDSNEQNGNQGNNSNNNQNENHNNQSGNGNNSNNNDSNNPNNDSNNNSENNTGNDSNNSGDSNNNQNSNQGNNGQNNNQNDSNNNQGNSQNQDNSHQHKYTSKVIAPTCIANGYTKHTCSCGDSYEDTYTDKLGHKYKDKVIAPTTANKGYTEHTCSVCGDTYKDSYVDKLPSQDTTHTHKYTSKTIASTCTEKGYTLYTCSCGDSYKDNYKNLKEHTYTHKTIAPTTESKGYTEHTCSVCGYSYKSDYTDKLPAHTHSYSVKITAPTCTEKGYATHTCGCGHSYKDSYKDATGHTYKDTVVAPTTTSQGYTEHKCSVCGHSYKDNYTDKLPEVHQHSYKIKVVAPTCEDEGYTEHTCSCGESYRDSYERATGHTYNNHVVAPTVDSQGYTEHVCKICGFTYRDNYKDKLPPEESDPGKDDEHDGNGMVDAGVFGQHSSESAPVYDGSTDYNSVVNKLNGYVFDVYGYRFFRNGLAQNDNQTMGTAKIVQNADGKFGITIIGWRHSYDSSATVNTQLNAVLEAMRYFAGGNSNVAYSLWSFCDYKNINGSANSDNFGFHDIEKTSIGWIIEMDGVKILLDNTVSGQTTYWFI